MDSELLSKLREIVAARATIVSAYVFGSHASGRARADSDLDLAVVWDTGLDERAVELARRDLTVALADELGALADRVDLVDLRAAGATLAFRVIRDGKLIHTRDPRAKTGLEARIARRYDDEEPYRRLFREAAIRAGRRLETGARGRS